ncbi:MAG: hypothetical protein Q9186_002563 [Xanthomendoza sp. 1 TL-2023]
MRSSMISAAAFVAGAAAHLNGTEPVYVTELVTAFTTFCPASTQITHRGETYTVTAATTLIITNCHPACTVTKPASSVPVVYCPTCPATPVVPVVPTTSAVVPAPSSPAVSVPTQGPITETHPAVSVPTQGPVTETHPAPVVPETHPAPVIPSTAVPVPTGSSGPTPPVVNPPIYGNTTVPVVPGSPTGVTTVVGTAGTASPSGSSSPNSPVTPFQGAAPKMAASSLSLVGLLGLAAFFL